MFIGLLLLLFVTIRSFRGHYSPEAHRGVEVPGIYWHFVDIMWIVVYTTVVDINLVTLCRRRAQGGGVWLSGHVVVRLWRLLPVAPHLRHSLEEGGTQRESLCVAVLSYQG